MSRTFLLAMARITNIFQLRPPSSFPLTRFRASVHGVLSVAAVEGAVPQAVFHTWPLPP